MENIENKVDEALSDPKIARRWRDNTDREAVLAAQGFYHYMIHLYFGVDLPAGVDPPSALIEDGEKLEVAGGRFIREPVHQM